MKKRNYLPENLRDRMGLAFIYIMGLSVIALQLRSVF